MDVVFLSDGPQKAQFEHPAVNDAPTGDQAQKLPAKRLAQGTVADFTPKALGGVPISRPSLLDWSNALQRFPTNPT